MDWRLCWAWAAALWGSILTLIVEITSSFRLFAATPVFVAWLLVDVALVIVAAQLARKRGVPAATAFSECFVGIRQGRLSEWPVDARWFLGGTALLVSFLFGLALIMPTANWDSLTYHLPRVLHWIQQQSVEHYPTNIGRQLEIGPWPSFVTGNILLLHRSDRLLNLVQWGAMLSSIIVLSLAAKQLGVLCGLVGEDETALGKEKQKRVAALTCLLTATVPIGIAESITTQTDYVTAFWLCSLLVFLLALLRDPSSLFCLIGAALSFALGVLSKATMCIYAAPILGVSAVLLWRRMPNLRAKAFSGFVFATLFLLLNFSHMWRNYRLLGSPIGSSYNFGIERNQRISFAVTLSNVIRNLSLHTNSGVSWLTKGFNKGLATCHKLTGEPISSPDTTYETFVFVNQFFVYDSYASSPYHVMLILFAGAIALCSLRQQWKLLLFAAVILSGVFLFCGYLKWQQWHTRRHLVFLLLFMPFVSWVLVARAPRCASWLAAAVVQLFACYCIARNDSCPILNARFLNLPRERQHAFVHSDSLNQPLAELTGAIVAAKPKNVGLKLGYNHAEYPIWVMLKNRGFEGTIQHYYIENESAAIPSNLPVPDVIISMFGSPPEAVAKEFPFSENYGRYTVLWREKPLKVASRSASVKHDEPPLTRPGPPVLPAAGIWHELSLEAVR
jgi:4-amino-4-deoxy-L-arabinose transferase-like glycosyltransferase